AQGKENVKVHRLKEPNKTKYEIYDVLKVVVLKCRNWNELKKELQKQGITLDFKHKGNTNEVQGVLFEKNGYKFNGSKIDRQFSYSKIDYQLKQNDKIQNIPIQQEHNPFQNQPSVLENVGSALGGLFDFQPSGMDYDHDEAEFQQQQKLKKKKKKRRPYL
ncbi:MAG: relaxase/mobilization nuclease domain-containing protein, partial [Bacteroidales bacterium]|nr:relaxase/mobilization nuclease domain-containing protein [Bacteroidales bacterium]